MAFGAYRERRRAERYIWTGRAHPDRSTRPAVAKAARQMLGIITAFAFLCGVMGLLGIVGLVAYFAQESHDPSDLRVLIFTVVLAATFAGPLLVWLIRLRRRLIDSIRANELSADVD